ncbi:hypothetical protein BU16DRAFT_464302, partial [Lophium mytilinum]
SYESPMSLEGKLGFVPEPNGRGTRGLLWSCVFTWILCLWVLFHINIPTPNESTRKVAGPKTWFFFLGIIGPEWVATMAFTQFRDAQQFVIQMLRQLPLTHWTPTQGFYCGMGGFAIIPPEGLPKQFPVNTQQLCWLIENGHVKPPTITLKEIRDKSKMDSLLKGFALVQTLWFAAQYIARNVQRLDTSTLEVMTISYIVSTLPFGLLWWRKPYDVDSPTLLEPHIWP